MPPPEGGEASRLRRALLLAAAGAAVVPSWAHKAPPGERLPVVGPAPDFVLTDQGGRSVSLAGQRGKIVAVTFIFASCKDTCPILTSKMVKMQRDLGADFGSKVRFLAVTVEPEVDTPEVLAAYGQRFGADPAGWSFLTGTPVAIGDVVRRYGAFAKRAKPGDVDHTFLTSLVDRGGMMRVQYLGYRFDGAEMLRDLRALLRE